MSDTFKEFQTTPTLVFDEAPGFRKHKQAALQRPLTRPTLWRDFASVLKISFMIWI